MLTVGDERGSHSLWPWWPSGPLHLPMSAAPTQPNPQQEKPCKSVAHVTLRGPPCARSHWCTNARLHHGLSPYCSRSLGREEPSTRAWVFLQFQRSRSVPQSMPMDREERNAASGKRDPRAWLRSSLRVHSWCHDRESLAPAVRQKTDALFSGVNESGTRGPTRCSSVASPARLSPCQGLWLRSFDLLLWCRCL